MENTFKLDVDFVSKAIAECAQDHVMPRFRALAAHEIKTKSGPNDLVTQADLDMERALGDVLLKAWPGTKILGEEGMAAGTASLDLFSEANDGVWVIDPVDGTYNFVHGSERFGTLVAFVRGGQTLAGWIYDIPRRAMTVVQKGRGVFREGARLGLSRVETADQALGGIGLHYFQQDVRAVMAERVKAIRGHVCLHCAAHEYLDILDGKVDFAIHSRANPWDHLAGILAVEELGGVVKTWAGQQYNPAQPEHILIAANAPLWTDVQAKLLQGLY